MRRLKILATEMVMSRIKMVVRNNPWDILKNQERVSLGRKVFINEIVKNTIKSIPPPPLSLRSAIPEEIGAFVPEKLPPASSLKKPAIYIKPFPIVYPEDDIRKEFYDMHPFEFHRPMCVVETTETLKEREWTDIDGGSIDGNETKKLPLTGEKLRIIFIFHYHDSK